MKLQLLIAPAMVHILSLDIIQEDRLLKRGDFARVSWHMRASVSSNSSKHNVRDNTKLLLIDKRPPLRIVSTSTSDPTHTSPRNASHRPDHPPTPAVMDVIQGKSLALLPNILHHVLTVPPDWAAHFLSSDHAAITSYAYRLYRLTSTIRSWAAPLLQQPPDLTTLALTLVILFISLQILRMVVASILGWVRLAFKLAFWAGLTAVGVWMWQRGPQGVVQDCEYWAGVWGSEYGYWKDREQVAARVRRGGLPVGVDATGWGDAGGRGRWF